jgi:nitrite reductase/ring-hydroxylating ferredoxin subunit
MAWHRVADASELDEDLPLPVEVGKTLIALFKQGENVCATSNVCTHQFALMSDGFVDGEYIECPLHQGRFHIATGKAVCAPVCVDLAVYPAKIDGDAVFVDCD